jgi:hypothetical protein
LRLLLERRTASNRPALPLPLLQARRHPSQQLSSRHHHHQQQLARHLQCLEAAVVQGCNSSQLQAANLMLLQSRQLNSSSSMLQ